MPRRLRFAPPGYWLHLTQRGNHKLPDSALAAAGARGGFRHRIARAGLLASGRSGSNTITPRFPRHPTIASQFCEPSLGP